MEGTGKNFEEMYNNLRSHWETTLKEMGRIASEKESETGKVFMELNKNGKTIGNY